MAVPPSGARMSSPSQGSHRAGQAGDRRGYRRALVAAAVDVLSISESRHSLEDVYLELIDQDVEATR